jgi:hypothetical protein
VVSGIVGFYCLFAMIVGLAGRYDLTLGALAILALLRRVRRAQVEVPGDTGAGPSRPSVPRPAPCGSSQARPLS